MVMQRRLNSHRLVLQPGMQNNSILCHRHVAYYELLWLAFCSSLYAVLRPISKLQHALILAKATHPAGTEQHTAQPANPCFAASTFPYCA
jgi:hypothetical protein